MNKSIFKVFMVIIPLLAFVPAMAQFDNAFQSTSAMAGSGSNYASAPSINSYGQATYGDVVPNRGRTDEWDDIDDPDNPEGDDNPNPIGSAVPAMLLLAGTYAGVVAIRRRRQQV